MVIFTSGNIISVNVNMNSRNVFKVNVNMNLHMYAKILSLDP